MTLKWPIPRFSLLNTSAVQIHQKQLKTAAKTTGPSLFCRCFLLWNCEQEADLHVFISRNMHGHAQAHPR